MSHRTTHWPAPPCYRPDGDLPARFGVRAYSPPWLCAGYLRGLGVISAMPYIFLSPHLPLDTPRGYQAALRNTAIQVLSTLSERRVLP